MFLGRWAEELSCAEGARVYIYAPEAKQKSDIRGCTPGAKKQTCQQRYRGPQRFRWSGCQGCRAEGRRGFEGRVAEKVQGRGPQRFRRSGYQVGAEPRAAEVSKVRLPRRCRAAAKAAVARKAEARSTRVELPMRVKVEKKRPPRDKIFPKKFCRQCPQTQTNELASPPSPTGWPIPTFWRCSSNHSTTFSS